MVRAFAILAAVACASTLPSFVLAKKASIEAASKYAALTQGFYSGFMKKPLPSKCVKAEEDVAKPLDGVFDTFFDACNIFNFTTTSNATADPNMHEQRRIMAVDRLRSLNHMDYNNRLTLQLYLASKKHNLIFDHDSMYFHHDDGDDDEDGEDDDADENKSHLKDLHASIPACMYELFGFAFNASAVLVQHLPELDEECAGPLIGMQVKIASLFVKFNPLEHPLAFAEHILGDIVHNAPAIGADILTVVETLLAVLTGRAGNKKKGQDSNAPFAKIGEHVGDAINRLIGVDGNKTSAASPVASVDLNNNAIGAVEGIYV